MHWLNEIGRALELAAMMGWQMLWALILGFALSAVVQATVSREKVANLMPDGGPRSIAVASGLAAASSSCSYAAVAIARTLFRKGADFRAAMAFEFASTNLVFELGLSLIVLMGWRFAAAEFMGGPVMIVLLVLLMNAFFGRRLVDGACEQAERGLLGRMEGHAAMDMAAEGDTWLARLRSPEAFTAISNIFVMEWAAVLGDIVLGLLLAVIALLYGAQILYQTLVYGVDVPGYPSLFVGMMVLGSVQLVMLGVLVAWHRTPSTEEMLGKVLSEIKARPVYFVAEHELKSNEESRAGVAPPANAPRCPQGKVGEAAE